MSKSVEREEFEAFVSAPPFEYGLEIQPENGAWPGNYRSIAVQLAWEAWQARGAALSIQQEADAKKLAAIDAVVKGWLESHGGHTAALCDIADILNGEEEN
jgi:hypothetical protein